MSEHCASSPAFVVPETASEIKPATRRAPQQTAQGRIVIEVGRRVVVNGAVDAEALARDRNAT